MGKVSEAFGEPRDSLRRNIAAATMKSSKWGMAQHGGRRIRPIIRTTSTGHAISLRALAGKRCTTLVYKD